MIIHTIDKRKAPFVFLLWTTVLFGLFFALFRANKVPISEIYVALSVMGIFCLLWFLFFLKSKWHLKIEDEYIEINDKRNGKPKQFPFSNIKSISEFWNGIFLHLDKAQYGTRKVKVQLNYATNPKQVIHEVKNHLEKYRQNIKTEPVN